MTSFSALFSYYCSSTKCWYTPHPAKGTFCTTTIVKRKKSAENDFTSRYVVTSGHVTFDVISVEVIYGDVTSGRRKNRFCDENENISKKLRENDTRKMTSCTHKTSNVGFQTLRFEKVRLNEMSYDVMYAENN